MGITFRLISNMISYALKLISNCVIQAEHEAERIQLKSWNSRSGDVLIVAVDKPKAQSTVDRPKKALASRQRRPIIRKDTFHHNQHHGGQGVLGIPPRTICWHDALSDLLCT